MLQLIEHMNCCKPVIASICACCTHAQIHIHTQTHLHISIQAHTCHTLQTQVHTLNCVHMC